MKNLNLPQNFETGGDSNKLNCVYMVKFIVLSFMFIYC